MLLQTSAYSRAALLFAVALLTAVPLSAQDVEVPRTRTFPGVRSAAGPLFVPVSPRVCFEPLDSGHTSPVTHCLAFDSGSTE